MGHLFEVNNIHTYYGLAHILQGVTLFLDEGEAVALMGRNGEGKTTTFKSIMALVPPREGEILFEGEKITGLPPNIVSHRGIGMVPEGRHIFPALSVMDHLRVPVPPPGAVREELFEKAFTIFPNLREKRKALATSLSGGQQQMLVIARALMTKPKLLLLDEPMEGLSPKATYQVIDALKIIQSEGVTILFASANCERAFLIASRAYIITKGKIAYQGPKDELLNSPEIQQRFLGVRE
jgi:branched-chain amino acid transport system ATP-binding protein